MFIKEVVPSIIKNSRGEETIQVVVKTPRGKFIASAPGGKSTGKYEVPAFNKSINWSLKILSEFCYKMYNKTLAIESISDLENFEKVLKQFEFGFGGIGANGIYALETALLKAAAKDKGMELWEFIIKNGNKKSDYELKMPIPVGNCIGGGMHSKGVKGKKPDFQEFLFISKENSVAKAIRKNLDAYEKVRILLKKKHKTWGVKRNDEGAWETSLTNEEALEIMKKVAAEYGLNIGVDVASSTFYSSSSREYSYKNKKIERTREEQIEYMRLLADKFKLVYIEDPIQQEDFNGFTRVLSELEKHGCLIIGDDLTVTNLERTKTAFGIKSINSMIVKPNQIGSLVEVTKVIDFCKKNKIKIIFSHRSGETMDDALADYAVGFQADFIKTGIYGKERLIKLRR
jgi:enolase